MHVPSIKISETTQATMQKIINVTKQNKKLTIGEQMNLASFYAYLKNGEKNDLANHAKLSLGL